MFTLDTRLKNDTYHICDLKISSLLLMNDANYTWLILVPRKPDLIELTDLSFAEQTEVLSEINLVAKILKKEFSAEKLNIAALGNVVSQLHIHVIARKKNDATFPKPVWGNAEAKKYDEAEAQNLIQKINKLLAPSEDLIKQILYRSLHRGCKETDFLIGKFAENKLSEINDLELFGRFLEEDDAKIYDWLLDKEPAPEYYSQVILQIKEFHNLS
jgi:diadenosine tetraphosphate (Ap4A) HIT family hydrolase/succinate dehydrogenase flavin-adding protein (antitoxin of CptAB toxin-antitoxin module)